ncbi:protein Atg16l2 [Heptranchias perlo]|uniref:protein Atg16l2 n=1 Tax=Heptranchias perlo TaxID=212740 RepID=UPI00355A650A
MAAPGGWRRHIGRQLRHRDRQQKLHFQTLILSYNQLLEKSNMVQLWRDNCDPHLLSAPSPPPEPENVAKLQIKHQEKLTKLHQANGEVSIYHRLHGMDLHAGTLQNVKTLEGSNDGITSIEFDPSGLQILAGSYDNTARLWSLKDCELKQTLSGHSAKVTAAKFKSYFREAVTASHDRTLKIWDLNKAACVKSIHVPSRCSDIVCSDYFIISGHFDKTIRLWDCRTGTNTDEIPLQGKVTSLDINSDRTQLLSCSRDDLLKVTDLRMNEVRQELRAEGFKCGADWTKAIFSPDGNYAVAGSSDGVLYVWDVCTGKLETSLVGQHRSSINAVSWSRSGEFVVSVDRSKIANLWADC